MSIPLSPSWKSSSSVPFLQLCILKKSGQSEIFLYHDAGVKDGVRYYHSSTTWFRNVGEEDFETKLASQEPRQGMYEDQPVFYLKELTKDNEDNFVTQRHYTGDSLPVQALFQGQPVAGLPVTLTTQQGWEKTVVTDDKGIASFLLIKEVFHTDKVHKKLAVTSSGGLMSSSWLNRTVGFVVNATRSTPFIILTL